MRNWLIEMRKARGLSQKDVAKMIGISQPSYCEIEHVLTNPRLITAIRLGDLLGFEISRFGAKAAPEHPEQLIFSGAETPEGGRI